MFSFGAYYQPHCWRGKAVIILCSICLCVLIYMCMSVATKKTENLLIRNCCKLLGIYRVAPKKVSCCTVSTAYFFEPPSMLRRTVEVVE